MLNPRLMLIPTTMEAMAWDTEDMEATEAMVWDTEAMDMEAMVWDMEDMVDTVDTTASVMLMLNLRLMLIPTTMEAMAWDTEAMDMEAMDLDTEAMDMEAMVWAMEATVDTMASVMLMLSLRLMLIPTTMEDMDWAMDWAMEATEAMAMDWDTAVSTLVVTAMGSMVAKKFLHDT